MMRRLFHLASSLSLLAAVIVAALEIISLHRPVAVWHIKTGIAGGTGASTRFLLVINNKLASGPYKRVQWLGISDRRIVLADYTEPVSPLMPNWDFLFTPRPRSDIHRGDFGIIVNVADVQAMQKRDGSAYVESIFRDERGLYAWRTPPAIERLRLATTINPRATVQSVGTIFHNSYSGGEHLFRLQLPIWFVLPALLIAPVVRIAFWWRRRRRLNTGRCPVCSYDLTFNVSGICPECGSPAIRDAATRAQHQM